jgi:DNA-binding ferritin-like protein
MKSKLKNGISSASVVFVNTSTYHNAHKWNDLHQLFDPQYLKLQAGGGGLLSL